jgi:hypothetical protein
MLPVSNALLHERTRATRQWQKLNRFNVCTGTAYAQIPRGILPESQTARSVHSVLSNLVTDGILRRR